MKANAIVVALIAVLMIVQTGAILGVTAQPGSIVTNKDNTVSSAVTHTAMVSSVAHPASVTYAYPSPASCYATTVPVVHYGVTFQVPNATGILWIGGSNNSHSYKLPTTILFTQPCSIVGTVNADYNISSTASYLSIHDGTLTMYQNSTAAKVGYNTVSATGGLYVFNETMGALNTTMNTHWSFDANGTAALPIVSGYQTTTGLATDLANKCSGVRPAPFYAVNSTFANNASIYWNLPMGSSVPTYGGCSTTFIMHNDVVNGSVSFDANSASVTGVSVAYANRHTGTTGVFSGVTVLPVGVSEIGSPGVYHSLTQSLLIAGPFAERTVANVAPEVTQCAGDTVIPALPPGVTASTPFGVSVCAGANWGSSVPTDLKTLAAANNTTVISGLSLTTYAPSFSPFDYYVYANSTLPTVCSVLGSVATGTGTCNVAYSNLSLTVNGLAITANNNTGGSLFTVDASTRGLTSVQGLSLSVNGVSLSVYNKWVYDSVLTPVVAYSDGFTDLVNAFANLEPLGNAYMNNLTAVLPYDNNSCVSACSASAMVIRGNPIGLLLNFNAVGSVTNSTFANTQEANITSTIAPPMFVFPLAQTMFYGNVSKLVNAAPFNGMPFNGAGPSYPVPQNLSGNALFYATGNSFTQNTFNLTSFDQKLVGDAELSTPLSVPAIAAASGLSSITSIIHGNSFTINNAAPQTCLTSKACYLKQTAAAPTPYAAIGSWNGFDVVGTSNSPTVTTLTDLNYISTNTFAISSPNAVTGIAESSHTTKTINVLDYANITANTFSVTSVMNITGAFNESQGVSAISSYFENSGAGNSANTTTLDITKNTFVLTGTAVKGTPVQDTWNSPLVPGCEPGQASSHRACYGYTTLLAPILPASDLFSSIAGLPEIGLYHVTSNTVTATGPDVLFAGDVVGSASSMNGQYTDGMYSTTATVQKLISPLPGGIDPVSIPVSGPNTPILHVNSVNNILPFSPSRPNVAGNVFNLAGNTTAYPVVFDGGLATTTSGFTWGDLQFTISVSQGYAEQSNATTSGHGIESQLFVGANTWNFTDGTFSLDAPYLVVSGTVIPSVEIGTASLVSAASGHSLYASLYVDATVTSVTFQTGTTHAEYLFFGSWLSVDALAQSPAAWTLSSTNSAIFNGVPYQFGVHTYGMWLGNTAYGLGNGPSAPLTFPAGTWTLTYGGVKYTQFSSGQATGLAVQTIVNTFTSAGGTDSKAVVSTTTSTEVVAYNMPASATFTVSAPMYGAIPDVAVYTPLYVGLGIYDFSTMFPASLSVNTVEMPTIEGVSETTNGGNALLTIPSSTGTWVVGAAPTPLYYVANPFSLVYSPYQMGGLSAALLPVFLPTISTATMFPSLFNGYFVNDASLQAEYNATGGYNFIGSTIATVPSPSVNISSASILSYTSLMEIGMNNKAVVNPQLNNIPVNVVFNDVIASVSHSYNIYVDGVLRANTTNNFVWYAHLLANGMGFIDYGAMQYNITSEGGSNTHTFLLKALPIVSGIAPQPPSPVIVIAIIIALVAATLMVGLYALDRTGRFGHIRGRRRAGTGDRAAR